MFSLKKLLTLTASILFFVGSIGYAAFPSRDSNAGNQFHSGSATYGIGISTNGILYPEVDNTCDMGTSTREFKNLYIDGTAKVDTLTVDESATIANDLTVTDDTTLTDDVEIQGILGYDDWDQILVRSTETITPTSSFCILHTTETGTELQISTDRGHYDAAIISTVNMVAGMYVTFTSTQDIIAFGSFSIHTSRLRLPESTMTLRAGDYVTVQYDGTYWSVVSSKAFTGVYP